MSPVAIEVTQRGFDRVGTRLRGYPAAIFRSMDQSLRDYFFEDFKPMLKRVLGGFRAVNVPARNAPRWASIKASVYGVNHSLGRITGKLQDDSMSVTPDIRRTSNKVILKADYSNIPKAGYPYMPIVHEGFDGLSQPYPMVEAARLMTHRKLLRRMDANMSQSWKTSGG